MSRKELIKRAHEYADSTFISLLDLHKEDPDGDKSIHNMRSMAYFEGALYAINLFLAECDGADRKLIQDGNIWITWDEIQQIAARLQNSSPKGAELKGE